MLGLGSKSAGAEEQIDVSPIMKKELVAAAAATAALDAGSTTVVDGGSRSTRRRGRKLPRVTRDWSSLPEPAIQLILMDLRPSLGAVFSFSGVCKAWRSVFTDCKRELFSSLPPLLVDCGSSPDALGRFYSLVEQRFFRRKQPIPRWFVNSDGSLYFSDWRVSGVSHGYWILTPVKNSERRPVFLLDPLFPESGIELPPSPLLFNRILAGEFRWALMTAPPTSPDCVVVVADTRRIWYCRRGDTEWVRYDFNGVLDPARWSSSAVLGRHRLHLLARRLVARYYFKDRVAVLGRRLYVLARIGKVVVLELLFPRPRVAVMDVENPVHCSELGQLVESDGDILYIADEGCSRREVLHRCLRPDGLPRCEHRYVVWRLDLPARRWVALDTLGKRSIFLPRHCQWGSGWRGTPLTCVGAAEWGGREDCIYTDCVTSDTVVVWNMKDASVEHHPLPEGSYSCAWLAWSVPSFSCRQTPSLFLLFVEEITSL